MVLAVSIPRMNPVCFDWHAMEVGKGDVNVAENNINIAADAMVTDIGLGIAQKCHGFPGHLA